MTNNLCIEITGNPFIDSGIYALKNRLNKDISDITLEDLKSEAKFISKLYTKKSWQSNMHNIFPNSKLVNTSVKGNREEEYYKVLLELIDSIDLIQNEGSCMGCGKRIAKNTYFKNMIPLTGSGSLLNYFSYGKLGDDYCSLCVLLVQFSPLIMYRCGGKYFIVLQSNSEKVMNFWAEKGIDSINTQFATGDFTGCYTQGIIRPTNVIFNIIAQIITSGSNWRGENPSFNFYYFSNFNKGAELEIFTLPTSVFNFLTEIHPKDWKNWSLIIKRGYKNVNWDKVKSYDDFKNNPNKIYNNLLSGNSILKFFYSIKFKKTFCSWNLVKSYLMEVWMMDEERIQIIRNVGDKLSTYIMENKDVKSLQRLEIAPNYNTFRNLLKRILKNKLLKDNELLFTFDEYVFKLFPEGNLSWKETQDLLLFRIYENLNEWLVENNYAKILENEPEEDENV